MTISYSQHVIRIIGCTEEQAQQIETEMRKSGPIDWLELKQFEKAAVKAAQTLNIKICQGSKQA